MVEISNLQTPAEGTLDWHIPLNENFEAIEADVRTLANEVGITGVGGYTRPAEGTLDWHIPLNENFKAIEADLSAIADTVDVTLSGMSTLSNVDVWHTLVGSGVDLSGVVYDATAYSGQTLAQQVENAYAAARSEVSGHALIRIPSGSYSWDRVVAIATGETFGVSFLFDTDAQVTVTSDWAFDFTPANQWMLTNDQRTKPVVAGGAWTVRGTGWVRARDIYRGFMAPRSVTGGTYGVYVDTESTSTGGFSEGWTIRDAVFEGVSEPVYFYTGSADQQLLANLTFRDFDRAVYYDDSSGQNYTGANLLFENPRTDAVGMRFGKYTTGTVFNSQWMDGAGTAFVFDDWTKPSIVDPVVDSGAQFSVVNEGGDELVSTDAPDWQKGHSSPILTGGGPTAPTPVVRTDAYSGSLPARVEAAVEDLPNGGTVLIPGAASHSWDRTATIQLAGRDIAIVTTPNNWIDVSSGSWALDVRGDGYFGFFGGFWVGQESSSQGGFLTIESSDADLSPTEIRKFSHGPGIDARPVSKGRYRVYDLRYIHTAQASGTSAFQLGGAGCSQLLLSHTETENTNKCYRFDSPVDDFHGMRLSAHPWRDGAVFAETNAPLDGTWYNTKWEIPGRSNTVVYDNSGTDSPAALVEPWAWSNGQDIELWRGTKPQMFPDTSQRVAIDWNEGE
jgi:hypothetical protein